MSVKNWDELPLVLTAKETQEILRLSPITFYRLVQTGVIPAKKIGGKRFFVPRDALRNLVEGPSQEK